MSNFVTETNQIFGNLFRASSHLNSLADNLYVIGLDKLAEKLMLESQSIEKQSINLRKLLNKKSNEDFQKCQESSANLIKAALYTPE